MSQPELPKIHPLGYPVISSVNTSAFPLFVETQTVISRYDQFCLDRLDYQNTAFAHTCVELNRNK